MLAQIPTFWNDGRFLLVSIAALTIALLVWATWLRARLMKQASLQKAQQERGSQQEHFYAELVEHASDVIFRLDRVGTILAINKAGAELLGYKKEDLIGKNLSDFAQTGSSDSLSLDGSKEYVRGNLVLMDKDQQQVHLEMSLRRDRVEGKTVCVEVIARNVTERRRFEAQLRQSERMQAMGLLAGGVAHDFNNYLTVILNFADLALEAETSEDIKQMLVEIRKAGLIASEMSRHMLDFSRRQMQSPQKLRLNMVITDLQRMLHSALGKKIDLKLQLTTGLPEIRADVGSVEQVLMNLVLNARDAIADAGKVTIRTLPDAANQRVLMEISDTGSGMDAATQANLFQPFFTTKDATKGTGLGLSSVQRIMLKLGGSIHVDSKVGEGSTFRLSFPVA